MKRGHTWAAVASLAAVSAVALTGCSSHTDTGTAKAVDSSAAAAAAKLDTGTFPTTPQPAFSKAGSPQAGAIVEGQRLAEYVVHPWDIDVNLTHREGVAAYVIKSASAASNFLTKPVAESIAGDKFVTGFMTSASDGDTVGHSNVHAVMRFADPASAQKAANDLRQADLTTNLDTVFGGTADPNTPPNVGTEDRISTLPNSLVDTHDSNGNFSITTITPHGSYVLYDWFQGKGGSALDATKKWAATSAATSLQMQGPKIDAFPATPVDQLAGLPVDVDGVLRLTIPPASGQASVNQNSVYGPNGFLNFSSTPIQDKQLIQQSGTDRVAFGATTVYRTRDEQGAKVLLDGFAQQNDESMHVAPAVPGLPGSKCWVGDGNAYQSQTTCLISRGRFIANIVASVDKPSKYAGPTTAPAPAAGSDITLAHQKAAAQYEILAGQH